MAYRVSNTYLENRVLGASPLELVTILYEEAAKSVREAAAAIRAGDIRGRSREITRAQLILGELSGSLNLDAGGELAVRLNDLYSYMQRRLAEAHVQQSMVPLEEVGRLLATLTDGWQKCATNETTPHRPVSPEAMTAV
jgi:flagellar protein FliS